MSPGYYRPPSLDKALELVASYGEQARPFAGGTDVLVDQRSGRLPPGELIDLKAIPELQGWRWEEAPSRALVVGACASMLQLRRDSAVAATFPALAEAMATVGGWPTQVRATLAGNLVSAVPAADTAPPLLAYEAELELVAAGGSRRRLAVSEWFLGPRRCALGAGELVLAIRLPAPGARGASTYLKAQRVRGADLALVGVAVVRENGRWRVAHCAAAPTPRREAEVEAALQARSLKAAVDALRSAVQPIDDVRASADFRRHLAGVLLERAVEACGGVGPA